MNVTYYELSNYNGGLLIAKTFELDNMTAEEHSEERSDWLKELTERTGELCEEWIIADTDEVPDRYVGEWGIDPEFWEYKEKADSIDPEVLEAGVELGLPLGEIADKYHGRFESEEALAEAYLEGSMDALPAYVQQYFDYAAYGRDLVLNSLYEQDGHYFWNH